MPVLPIAEIEPPWFYSISAMLGAGSVIEPGNWGRMLEMKQGWTEEDTEKWACETVYETVRANYAPDASSRTKAVFLCPSEADAIAFAKKYRPTDIVYAVEPASRLKSATLLDWSRFVLKVSGNKHAVWARNAKAYWTTMPENNRELLIEVPVTIIKRL